VYPRALLLIHYFRSGIDELPRRKAYRPRALVVPGSRDAPAPFHRWCASRKERRTPNVGQPEEVTSGNSVPDQ
jgi:hypothetical protein